jgi:hypothetical protein
MPPFFSFWGLGKLFGLFFWAASPMPIAPQGRRWMWASGHNGHIRHAAHGYEPTREAAMAAFGKSWRPKLGHGKRLVPAREPIRARPANSERLVLVL